MKVKDIKVGDTITLDCGYYSHQDIQECTVLEIDHRELHPLFGTKSEFYSFNVKPSNEATFYTNWFKAEDNI